MLLPGHVVLQGLAGAASLEEVISVWPLLAVIATLIGWIAETRWRVSELAKGLAEERVKVAALEKAKEKAEADLASLREWRNETKANIEALRANGQVNSERTTRIEGKVDSMHDDMKEVKGMLRSFIAAAGSGARASAA